MFTVAALLGCLVASGYAQQHESFRFTDSQGRCWTCAPGQACVPCLQNNLNPLLTPPMDHPTTCPATVCGTAESRAFLYPDPDPRFFLQCALRGSPPVWEAVRLECQCESFFDYELQSCQTLWDWVPWCTPLPNPIPPPVSCSKYL